jgi:TRAP-type C4-dicarboxylate transport system substrate-binding protein
LGRNLGARNFLTKFAFTDPAGLAGRKIRCLPTPVVTETVRLMGAAATPMAFGEVYTGLQAGVIDGLEHDAPTILSAKFYETAKNFTLTRHIYSPFGAFISDRTLQRLPAAQRDGLLLAVTQATDDHFQKAAQVETDAIAELKTKGVVVAECDRTVFRERVSPMWDRFADKTPGAKPMLDAIHQTMKA